MAKYYSPPKPGDIVQCRYPQNKIRQPGPKERPALVIDVEEYELPDGSPEVLVEVTYGTSEDVDNCHPGEIKIKSSDLRTGLGLDTKFNLGERCKLPFDDEWFAPSPNKKYGEHPKRGILDLTDTYLKRRFSSAVAELKQAGNPKATDMTVEPSKRKKADK